MKHSVTDTTGPRVGLARGSKSRAESYNLRANLGILFSPKQKELVLKRLRGEPFTKTEREYYSRVVKKKLKALASSEIREVAEALAGKQP